jgi:hypothetical protein
MIDVHAALVAAADFVAQLRADAHPDDYADLDASLARLDAAARAVARLTASERDYVAFTLDGGGVEALLERH